MRMGPLENRLFCSAECIPTYLPMYVCSKSGVPARDPEEDGELLERSIEAQMTSYCGPS